MAFRSFLQGFSKHGAQPSAQRLAAVRAFPVLCDRHLQLTTGLTRHGRAFGPSDLPRNSGEAGWRVLDDAVSVNASLPLSYGQGW